jgi:hypothetical protein
VRRAVSYHAAFFLSSEYYVLVFFDLWSTYSGAVVRSRRSRHRRSG